MVAMIPEAAVCTLAACQPSDLIRVPLRGASPLAFVAGGLEGGGTQVVVLEELDGRKPPFVIRGVQADTMVLGYGREYRIQLATAPDMVDVGRSRGWEHVGVVIAEPDRHLLCARMQGGHFSDEIWYEIGTGRLTYDVRRGQGAVFRKWNLLLPLPGVGLEAVDTLLSITVDLPRQP